MSRLYEYVLKSRGYSREQFVEEFPHPFLVVRHRSDAAASQWSFKTQTLSSSNFAVAEFMEKEGVTVAPEVMEYEVFEVKKFPGNPWPERISVGRAKNNDIVLSDNSVSKLHGHFVDAGEGELALIDAGSRNGSKVGQDALTPSQPRVVASGESVTFGAATLTFLSSGAMFELIESHVSADVEDSQAE